MNNFQDAAGKYTFKEVVQAQAPRSEPYDHVHYRAYTFPFVLWVMRHVNLPIIRILDLGCRDAQVCRMFPEPNLYVGMDLILAPIKFARSKGRQVVNGDVHFLPFKRFFDAIILRHVLEHVVNPYLAMCEILRVASSNAILGIVVPVTGEGPDAAHYQNFTKESIIEFLQPFGKILAIKDVETERRIVMALTKENAGAVFAHAKSVYKLEEKQPQVVQEPLPVKQEVPPVIEEPQTLTPEKASDSLWNNQSIALALHQKSLKNFERDETGVPKVFQIISPLLRGKSVVDFGCGTGVWAAKLYPFVKSYVGFDSSAIVLEIAKRYTVNLTSRCKFKFVDLGIYWEDMTIYGPADVVILLDYLRHLEPGKAPNTLENAARIAPVVMVFDCYGVRLVDHRDKEDTVFGIHVKDGFNVSRTLGEAEQLFSGLFSISEKHEVATLVSGQNSYVKYLHILRRK